MNKFLLSVKKFLSKPNTSWIIFAFLLSLYAVLMTNIGRDALFDWDEGIYAELGRQVIATGDLFTTYWNGAPWLEKPPGIAWVSGLGIALAGSTAYGARLLMPLIAIYVLYIVYRIGTHLGSYKHGLLAAGILAGFNLFLGRTRGVNTDMALLASITTTILFLLEKRPAHWVALSIFGGVWFKGIAGLLSVIIALPLILTQPKKYIIRLITLSAVLILPWHLYAYLKHGQDFLTPYFFEQVVRRATAQIEFHFEPRWYYFIYLYENLGLGVLIVAGLGMCSLLARLYQDRKNTPLYLTLLWWVLAPLALFTLAKTRLFWYILPVYPAISLVIAEIIGRFSVSKIQQRVLLILTIGVLVQGLFAAGRSVEIPKKTALIPDRLAVVSALREQNEQPLAVLVPESERLAEALLPEVARLSSSFRYGGMPSIVFYYQGPVEFYYNIDIFREYWQNAPSPLALVANDDLKHIPSSYQTVVSSNTYTAIQKGVYALR
jgi:4-amino-4-deoxy-L-arabinose transferase-like glycosyltransferase